VLRSVPVGAVAAGQEQARRVRDREVRELLEVALRLLNGEEQG